MKPWDELEKQRTTTQGCENGLLVPKEGRRSIHRQHTSHWISIKFLSKINFVNVSSDKVRQRQKTETRRISRQGWMREREGMA
jgi:hypothetical protein